MTTVLVADDDQQIRRILGVFLKGAGLDVVEARSGTEALTMLSGRRPDAILLDVMMPGANGFEVCKTLKSRPSTASIPVVLVTARDRREDIVNAIECGADDYVLKPFTKDTILKKVRQILEGGSRLQGMRPPGANRRRGKRVAVDWVVTWSVPVGAGRERAVFFKNRVRDVSLWGFSMDFERCAPCTGYERGTVHPACLVARFALRTPESTPLDFVLSAGNDVVVDVRGRIAHIYQPPEAPRTEIMGVAFTELSAKAEEILRRFVPP